MFMRRVPKAEYAPGSCPVHSVHTDLLDTGLAFDDLPVAGRWYMCGSCVREGLREYGWATPEEHAVLVAANEQLRGALLIEANKADAADVSEAVRTYLEETFMTRAKPTPSDIIREAQRAARAEPEVSAPEPEPVKAAKATKAVKAAK